MANAHPLPSHRQRRALTRTLSLKAICRMSDDEAFETFEAIRFASNGGEAFCPHCESATARDAKTRLIMTESPFATPSNPARFGSKN